MDIGDERSEGKAVAMPPLINVLAAAILSINLVAGVRVFPVVEIECQLQKTEESSRE